MITVSRRISITLFRNMTFCLCLGVSLSVTSVLASETSNKVEVITKTNEAVMKSVLSEVSKDQTAKTAQGIRVDRPAAGRGDG